MKIKICINYEINEGNNNEQLVLETESIQNEGELELIEEERIDLAKYYGLDSIDSEINVDNDNNKKYGIVYDVLLKNK